MKYKVTPSRRDSSLTGFKFLTLKSQYLWGIHVPIFLNFVCFLCLTDKKGMKFLFSSELTSKFNHLSFFNFAAIP